MIRTLLALVVSTVTTVECLSQIVVAGKVLNRDTHKPIAFANIGIIGSGVGSISNEDGSFSLPIPAKNLNDSLTFSAIGFGKKKVPINYFLGSPEKLVLLNEKAYTLNEVLVYEAKEKNKIFEVGNRSHVGGVLETDTLYSGRSIALLINPKSKKELQFPVYIQKASLRILRNNLPSFRFRIRLNRIDSVTGAPGEDILKKSIIVTSSKRSGWIDFDLSALHQLIDSPFFITFEQLVDRDDRTKIADGYREYIQKYPDKLKIDTVLFEGKKEVVKTLRGGIDLPGTFIAISKSDQHTSYERQTSFDDWKKVRGIVTAYATLSNQPLARNTPTDSVTCDSPSCKVSKICQGFFDDTGMNGMQLAIVKNGSKKISVNLGLADVKNLRPVTSDTRFRINSVSKSMTAAALIKLAASGKLALDSPVQKYLGDFPNIKEPFTTRQLAGHLAGIRDYREDNLSDFVRLKHYATSTDALEIVQNDTLLFKPGTTFHYSTFGWIIIGAVMEKVSQESYGSFMEQKIFKPLDLKNTCLDDVQKDRPNRSKFYDAAGNENEYGDWSYKYPGGGLLSTAEDLVSFGNELLNGKYFDQPWKTLLFESQRTADNTETGYGLGWYVGKDKRGNRIWHHAGDSFSSSSHLILYPDHNLIISFLGNAQDGAAFDWQGIADIALAME